jgi:hypothetical protein
MLIKQGADETISMTWRDDNRAPIDLTNFTMKWTLRPFFGSPIELLTLSSASSTGSRIVLNGTSGIIDMIFARGDTAALTPTGVPRLIAMSGGGNAYLLGVQDLQFTDPEGDVDYLFEGPFSLDLRSTI